MAILSKVIYRLNTIPIKLPMTFFAQLEKNHLKLHMEPTESPHSQVNSKQKEQSGRHHTTGLKVYYRGTVIKTAWYWYSKQNRPMEQNRGLEGNTTYLQPYNL